MYSPLSILRRLLSMSISAVVVAGVMMVVGAPTAQAHPGHGHVLIFTAAPAGPWHDAAIASGAPLLKTALEAEGMEVTLSADPTLFTDESLAQFDAMVAFQTNGDPWSAEQKLAMERWMQAGKGIAAIHNALDMRGNYPWWDNMVGSLMPGHAATGNDPGQAGTIRNEDNTHPSTKHFTDEEVRWDRADEWYNFSNNVRGTAHILQTMDESTYDPGGNAMGYDHPITWCKPYDGGRFWGTALGHFPSHYTEAKFMTELVGGVKYAAGLEEGDCGGTTWDSFERVPLDQNTSAPFGMDVADDGRVFYTEIVRGQIRMYNPQNQSVSTVLQKAVYSGGEDGMLGIALDPDFLNNGNVFVYYSPDSADNADPANFFSRVSRFTWSEAAGGFDPASEKVIIEFPASRLPDEPGHTGGSLGFDPQGNLYVGIGDDVNPHSEPSGGYGPLSERENMLWDARATSANTNDLRGKLLRITPKADGSGYTIPDGNLFGPGGPYADADPTKTRPEIYAMGFRNPFRFDIDPKTGWISLADYSPDNGNDAPATRGPAGIAEWNLIKSPGNYGWPLCMGANEPFRDVDYGTQQGDPVVVGEFFDCANPINDSKKMASMSNPGLRELPPARAADMYYGYQRSSVPSVIQQGGGLAPMGGPFYDYDPDSTSDTKFPEYYDGKPFFYEWARNKMYSIQLKGDAASAEPGDAVEKVNPFLPNTQFLAPIDSKFGTDGSLYVLDWGGGFGRDNPNSGVYRVDYISGSRSPLAKITVDKDSGPAPLSVAFDGTGSSDPEGAELTYAWDFEDDGTVDATTATATHEYTAGGSYTARLTVTDPDGKTGTTTVPITAGNTRPAVNFNLPPNGSFFEFPGTMSWDVEVTDAEDGTVNGADVIIQPALGHDEHAHPTEPHTGFTGSFEAGLGGHGPEENIFYAIDARYTDKGAGEVAPLTGSQTTLIYPKLRQAEFFNAKSSDATVVDSRDAAGGNKAVVGKDGAWLRYDAMSFYRIDDIALRVQAAAEGGQIEIRQDAPDGAVLKTVDVPATGATSYRDVLVDVSDLGAESRKLFFVFSGTADVKLNFVEGLGQGASETASPRVAITSPTDGEKLNPDTDVAVQATASDDGSVSKVEFFVGDTSLGVDDTAPYEVTWRTPAAEDLYKLTAVATDNDGRTTTSRVVMAQVGELFGDLVPFTNVDGLFEKIGTGAFRITGAGNDAWQGIDQYSTLYKPGGGDDKWEAIVKVDAHTMTNGAAKAGLIVRNDMTLPGTSPGYAMVALRPSGGIEFLTDPDGNGQLNASVQGGTSGTPKWLKLRRDEGGYSAYWSNDGTAWTQVGEKVQLANAAATQDVGIFEMAHEAAAKSADFSNFSIDTDPGDTEPPVTEVTYPGLSCVPGPLSDEFDSPSVLAKWTLRGPSATPISQSGGALNIPITTGDINEDSAGPVSFAGQPVPAGDWTATTKLTVAHTSHWQWAGIVVHQSDNEYNKLAFVRGQGGGRMIEFQSETGGSRTTPAAPGLPDDFPNTVFLKLTNTGGKLTGAYSADGETWTDLQGSLDLKTGAAAQLGLMGAGDLGTDPVVAKADWFRVTPDAEAAAFTADDEFDGAALDGCRWARTVRYDAAEAEVADGHLKITTQPGDINGANPISPRNFVLQKAPEGDFVATTKFKAPLKHRWQLAGLLMYADDDNYVKADVVATNTPGAALTMQAELKGEVNAAATSGGVNIDVPNATESGYWHLRVTRTGSLYTAEVSENGTNWTPIGDGITFDKPLDSLGLMAIGPEQEEATTVEFDYFHLEAEGGASEDTTAPETAIAWNPAAVDGNNGWYRTAPSFTLSATDDSGVASTEYQIGSGPWTAYADAVTLGEGESVVNYRSTDTADPANVEEAKTATVKVDTVAPETTATSKPGSETLTVTLAATDATSGVAGTEVSVDGGAWAPYTQPVVVNGSGSHTIKYRSTDNAGNVETEKSVVFETDESGPEIVLSGVSNGASYPKSTVLDLQWSALDAGSGVKSITATLDGRRINPGPLALTSIKNGPHTLVVTAMDEAGNTSVVKVSFKVRGGGKG